MIVYNTQAWTNHGWVWLDNLTPGDKVMSINHEKNYAEYDTVYSIKQEYMNTGIMGLHTKSMNMLVTRDHPIMLVDQSNQTVTRKPVEQIFNKSIKLHEYVLYNRMFDPHIKTNKIEDIKWSAQVAAIYCHSKALPKELKKAIDLTLNFGGYEARIWLDEFYHWNILRKTTAAFMYGVYLENIMVKNALFNIAPRAGCGIIWKLSDFNKKLMAHLTSTADIKPSSLGNWYLCPWQGNMIDVTTKNGNFLARKSQGTFYIACNKLGEMC